MDEQRVASLGGFLAPPPKTKVHAAQLGMFVLQGEVKVAAARQPDVARLALNPDRAKLWFAFDQLFD